jgi:hypothetical protein
MQKKKRCEQSKKQHHHRLKVNPKMKPKMKMNLESKNENGSEVLTFTAVVCSASLKFLVAGL